MTLEQALRLTNRNMIAFDLLLGSAAIAAPAATLRLLGHDEPSPDAKHLFRRCGPIWLTFAAAHAVAAKRDRPSDWQSLAWRGVEMGQFDGQPSIRWSLRGLTEEGDEAWLIRGIARKLYRCPGCHGDIEVGDEHTVVQFVRRLGGTDHHHWHRRCAEELLIPELGKLKRIPASESSQSKL